MKIGKNRNDFNNQEFGGKYYILTKIHKKSLKFDLFKSIYLGFVVNSLKKPVC